MKDIKMYFTPQRSVPLVTWRTILVFPISLIAVWAESVYLDTITPWVATVITTCSILLFVVIEWMIRLTSPSPSEGYIRGALRYILMIKWHGTIEPFEELKGIAKRLFLENKGHCAFNESELCVFLDLYTQSIERNLILPVYELSEMQMREGRRYLKVLRPNIGDPDVLEALVYGYALIGFLFTALNVDSKQDTLLELRIITTDFYDRLITVHEGSLDHWPAIRKNLV